MGRVYRDKWFHIRQGEAVNELAALPDRCIQCCVTSPPYYGLRDYGIDGQIGQELTPDVYVQRLVGVFREVRRVLNDDGTLWVNIGDSYAGSQGNAHSQNRGKGTQRKINKGSRVRATVERNGLFIPPGSKGFRELGIKPKDLMMIPARFALAMQADGWWLRSKIIWAKGISGVACEYGWHGSSMPESVKDRPSTAYEEIFLFTRSGRYYYDADAVKEPARYGEAHARKATSWGCNRKHPNKANVGRYAFAGDNRTCYRDAAGGYFRNLRNVWTLRPTPFHGSHFATFPKGLPEICIKAGSRPGDVVLDPFGGSGTTGLVSRYLGRRSVLIELNPGYIGIMRDRLGLPDQK